MVSNAVRTAGTFANLETSSVSETSSNMRGGRTARAPSCSSPGLATISRRLPENVAALQHKAIQRIDWERGGMCGPKSVHETNCPTILSETTGMHINARHGCITAWEVCARCKPPAANRSYLLKALLCNSTMRSLTGRIPSIFWSRSSWMHYRMGSLCTMQVTHTD